MGKEGTSHYDVRKTCIAITGLEDGNASWDQNWGQQPLAVGKRKKWKRKNSSLEKY